MAARSSTRSSRPALSRADSFAASSADALMLIGRVLVGGMFLESGWGKLMNMAGSIGYLNSLKVPSPEILVWLVLAVEIVVGVALIAGLATRYAALLGAIFVIVATALAHRYWEYSGAAANANHLYFMKNVAILGGLLYIFVAGAGRFALDAKWARKR